MGSVFSFFCDRTNCSSWIIFMYWPLWQMFTGRSRWGGGDFGRGRGGRGRSGGYGGARSYGASTSGSYQKNGSAGAAANGFTNGYSSQKTGQWNSGGQYWSILKHPFVCHSETVIIFTSLTPLTIRTAFAGCSFFSAQRNGTCCLLGKATVIIESSQAVVFDGGIWHIVKYCFRCLFWLWWFCAFVIVFVVINFFASGHVPNKQSFWTIFWK